MAYSLNVGNIANFSSPCRVVLDRSKRTKTLWHLGSLNGSDKHRITNLSNQDITRSALSVVADLKKKAVCIGKSTKSGTLVKDKNVRIDFQGRFAQDGQKYANIQMQINKHRRKGESTTISAVYVQTDHEGVVQIPMRYVRDALYRSLHKSREIWLRTQPSV